jgi:hypothetical protein
MTGLFPITADHGDLSKFRFNFNSLDLKREIGVTIYCATDDGVRDF